MYSAMLLKHTEDSSECACAESSNFDSELASEIGETASIVESRNPLPTPTTHNAARHANNAANTIESIFFMYVGPP